MGWVNHFKGIYHLLEDTLLSLHTRSKRSHANESYDQRNQQSELDEVLGSLANELRNELELVQGASHTFVPKAYLEGTLSPVFFGSAMNNFGVRELLNAFVEHAPPPQERMSESRMTDPHEENFSGFVFKNQANMGSRAS